MELFLIYLWLKLDHILAVATVFTAVCAACFLGLSFPVLGADEFERREAWYPQMKKLWVVLLFLLPLNTLFIVFTPSSRDVAILVNMAKSPEGQKIGTLIRGKANELLDSELEKLSKGTK